jgi:uncharacterized protein (TIGR03086 family)
VALDALVTTAEALSASDLRVASPCPGWSVGDVLEHALGVTVKFTAFAAGATDRPTSSTIVRSPDEVVPALRAAAAASHAAWAGIDRTRPCHLPFGSFPAETAAGINLFDALAHGSDVARPTGASFACPDAVWTAGLVAARAVIGPDRDARHYDPEIAVPADAPPSVRLLAFLGRSW